MNTLPKRKPIRIKDYDYSTPGAYFVTICTANREKNFWTSVGAATCRPQEISLSSVGKTVEQGILQIPDRYKNVLVDKYCIMPDHIHLILRIECSETGRQIAAPTIPMVVGHMKRWVSMQIGRCVWQKSFYEHAIRNRQDYEETWEYIEKNPLKYLQKGTP